MVISSSHNLPGQAVLEGLEPEMGYLSITYLNPQQELACQEFVLNGGQAKAAYMKAYPGTSGKSALANSSRLFKSEKVQQRIAEIRAELQRRYAVDAQSIIRLLTMSMSVDRRGLVDEAGRVLELHELPPEIAAVVDVEIVIDRTGEKHAIPVMVDRLKPAIELAKIMGLTKEKLEISGSSVASVNFYIPENGRDDIARIEELRTTFSQSKSGPER